MTKGFAWRRAEGRRSLLYGATLVSLAALLLATGCGKKEGNNDAFHAGGEWLDGMRASIEANVPDAGRAAQMLGIVERIEGDLNLLDSTVQEYYVEFSKMDVDYASTREDFERAYGKFTDRLEVTRSRIVDAALELRALSTREEWTELVGSDATIYENWRRRYTSLAAPEASSTGR